MPKHLIDLDDNRSPKKPHYEGQYVNKLENIYIKHPLYLQNAMSFYGYKQILAKNMDISNMTDRDIVKMLGNIGFRKVIPY